MKSVKSIKRRTDLIPTLLLVLSFVFANQASASWDYGNGRHGSFVLTTNATIEQLYQTVRLTNDPDQYNSSDSNAIPNFQNLIITNGATLTANAWNGSTGGRIVFKANGVLSIAGDSFISASGKGYRGGVPFQQGESYAGNPRQSTAANYGGGGGACASSCYVLVSGAGGGYALAGVNGLGGESGGSTYGTASLDVLYLGSGGGGGGGTYGGGGGGAILIQAANLQGNGRIQADGQGSGASVNGGGGAGSGGSIQFLVATATLGTNNVTAVGGINSGNGQTVGGNGGAGRIMVGYAESFTGITTPTAYASNDTSSDTINITNQPISQAVFLGSNVLFNVGFRTLSPYLMQWYFNGTPIPGATNQGLSLCNLSLTNQGDYWLTISNVVMTLKSANAFLTVLDTNDPTGGVIPNWWKEEYGLSTNSPTLATNYPTGDKLTYIQKYLYGLDPNKIDTDGDGLSDYDEVFVYYTNPLLGDTTGDGIPDGWKVQYSLTQFAPIANSEAGFDGVTYMQVYQYNLTHTNKLNPNKPFFAGQGLSNYEIINGGQHTNKYYYDHEDRLLGMESSRGISIGYQYDGNGNLLRQCVLSRTAETNGLPVLWLWLNGVTNQPGIAYASSSGNGWNNFQEWLAGLSPTSNSVPSLLNNPGTNIAKLAVPFTPTNWIMASGQLNGVACDEIVVGADGNVAGKTNLLFILEQGASSWQVTQLPVGAMGITSIVVGQSTNRPSPAIYIGLRQVGGTGAIWELSQLNGLWQTNVLAVSSNSAAFVLGVRSADVLGSFATNGQNGVLYSLVYGNGGWNQTAISTNGSNRGLGTHSQVVARPILNPAQQTEDTAMRLLDTGGIEMIGGKLEAWKNGLLLPTNWAFNPVTRKYYFESTNALNWADSESFAVQYGTHLTTISDANENNWVYSQFQKPYWIGLYMVDGGGSVGNIYGNWTSSGQGPNIYYYTYHSFWEVDPFYGFQLLYPYNYPATNGVCVGRNGNSLWNCVLPSSGYYAVADATGVQIYTNQWQIAEPSAINRLPFAGLSLSSGLPRPSQTNSTSIFYAYIDDLNQSGALDAGDDFSLAEFILSGNIWATNALVQIPINAGNVAPSFSLAAVDFTGIGKDILFTGEPDGRVYSWTGNDATNPLQRQLFSDAYVGQAWQSMAGIHRSGIGNGLAGALVNPTNQNTCNIIYWPSVAVLPTPLPNNIETAPYAVVLPSSATLGSNAAVSVRLWHDQGNVSTPFLQFQVLGSTNWQNATLTTLDGLSYSTSTRVTALPTGSTHVLTWNALRDVGANLVTNILLRANAQDFILTGAWSQPTAFQLNTANAIIPTNPQVNFSGISPVSGGFRFNWQGSTNAWLYLQRCSSLSGTNTAWVNIWTGAPPTLMFGSYTDLFGTNPMGFYRIKIVSP